MDLQDIGLENEVCIHRTQNVAHRRAIMKTITSLRNS
jgi:hypothetical protein